ncbi:hypothetical protein MMC11_003270, partial [Xylographa trunciseda]|nr:hypothetical protein [Xylographa trunciseda]
ATAMPLEQAAPQSQDDDNDSVLSIQATPIEKVKSKIDDLESGSGDGASPASKKAAISNEKPLDPNIVDWDGPEDPANPLNWPKSVRIGHVVLVSLITLNVYVPQRQQQQLGLMLWFRNLAATAFAPAASSLMADFGSTNTTIATLTVTIYLLGFALGPLLVAPLSELYGRLIVYHICNGIFLAFTIACAVSSDVAMFLVFRFITGCAGAAPLTIGGGTVADVIPQEQRGAAMAIFAVGPLLGPVIGPVMGGFISQSIGWRWTFWVLAIASGIISIVALVFMRETYSMVLLARKTDRLRKETGNLALTSKSDTGLTPRALFAQSVLRPLKLLFCSPIVFSLSAFCAFVFGLTYLLFTTFPIVFEEQYGFSIGLSGLAYLGLGISMIIGVILFSVMSDKMLKKQAGGGAMKPEYRLPLMVYFTPVIPVGFFWYGWSAFAKVHWIVPILGTCFIGIGSLFVIMPAQTYLVDAFGPYSASALAANTVLRSLFGTFLPFAGPPMYAALGLGWGNTLLGFLALAFAPVPWFFYKYGEQMRERWAVKL